eukprot:9095226-Prorocentrum_lima.AAC.1
MTESSGSMPCSTGWKPKARVVRCGNFEEGTAGGDWKSRAEVPGTYSNSNKEVMEFIGGLD